MRTVITIIRIITYLWVSLYIISKSNFSKPQSICMRLNVSTVASASGRWPCEHISHRTQCCFDKTQWQFNFFSLRPVFRTLSSRAHTAAVWTGFPSAPTRTWTVTERAVRPFQLRTSPHRTTCGLNSTRTIRSLARASGSLTSQVVQK